MAYPKKQGLYDPLFEKAGIDVVGTLATVGMFHHHGDEGVHVDVFRIAHLALMPHTAN